MNEDELNEAADRAAQWLKRAEAGVRTHGRGRVG